MSQTIKLSDEDAEFLKKVAEYNSLKPVGIVDVCRAMGRTSKGITKTYNQLNFLIRDNLIKVNKNTRPYTYIVPSNVYDQVVDFILKKNEFQVT